MIQTILVPLDGSLLAERAIPPAGRLAHATGAALVLVRTVHLTHSSDWDERRHEVELIAKARHYLETVRTRLEMPGLSVRTQVVPGPTTPGILFAAHACGADLICMATHGEAGVQRDFLGSVTEEVIRRTDLPILVTRVAQSSEEAAPFATILVGLDGTPAAEAALDYLARAGFDSSARLILLRALAPTLVEAMPGMASGAGGQRIYAQAEQATAAHRLEVEEYLRAVAGTRLPGRVCQTRVEMEDPATALLEAACLEHADLIVVTTHDRDWHGGERLVEGSVVHTVLQRAEASLLILPGRNPGAVETMGAGTKTHASPEPASREPVPHG